MQASCMRQHERYYVHKVATNVFLAPDRPVSECLPHCLKHQNLFNGNVPQPKDWLRAWRACRTAASFHSAAKYFETDDYAAGQRGQVDRFRLKKLITVMHWAVKHIRKEKLQRARSISISVDDRKVLLAVQKTGPQDKAQAMTSSVLDLLTEACRDPEGKVDSEALQHLRAHVRHCASDQCPTVQKSGKQLATCAELPNLAWLSYDPAHQIRIAFQDPLHAVPDFNEQWQLLFAGRHALIPDIKNSEVWKNRLLAAQKAVLDKHGSQAGLEKTMRAFSFAQPRFDSTATPMMKYCLLVRAIAILCAMQAVDERNNKEIRHRAELALQRMQGPSLFRCALTCDYTSECLRFLRVFDKEDPDAAKIPEILDSFCARLKLLFVDGYILADTCSAGPSGPQGPRSSTSPQTLQTDVDGKTITQRVYEEIETPEPTLDYTV
ncbi:unnamed protein product [Symbiodinium microadriaticum]|nr:unnamed protein product [Symbiodinium microadriaticum]